MNWRLRFTLRFWAPLSTRLAGKWSDGGADAWQWALRVRWWLSYYFAIGPGVFWDGRDDCEICGGQPSDMDFGMVRVGRRRARCDDTDCLLAAAQEDKQ